LNWRRYRRNIVVVVVVVLVGGKDGYLKISVFESDLNVSVVQGSSHNSIDDVVDHIWFPSCTSLIPIVPVPTEDSAQELTGQRAQIVPPVVIVVLLLLGLRVAK